MFTLGSRILFFAQLLFGPCYTLSPLIEPDGSPSNPLQRLLDLGGVEASGDLESIVTATQAAWLRPKGVERWKLKDRPELESLRHENYRARAWVRLH